MARGNKNPSKLGLRLFDYQSEEDDDDEKKGKIAEEDEYHFDW